MRDFFDILVLGILIAIIVSSSWALVVGLIWGKQASFNALCFMGIIMVFGTIVTIIIDLSDDSYKKEKTKCNARQ